MSLTALSGPLKVSTDNSRMEIPQIISYVTGAVSKTATAPLETVRMQMMTGTQVTAQVCRSTISGITLKSRITRVPIVPRVFMPRRKPQLMPAARLRLILIICRPSEAWVHDKSFLVQGTLAEVVRNTWARGGLLGFFSGNEAGDKLKAIMTQLHLFADNICFLSRPCMPFWMENCIRLDHVDYLDCRVDIIINFQNLF